MAGLSILLHRETGGGGAARVTAAGGEVVSGLSLKEIPNHP